MRAALVLVLCLSACSLVVDDQLAGKPGEGTDGGGGIDAGRDSGRDASRDGGVRPDGEDVECGNGTTEPGEQCDEGARNGEFGSGCTDECAFECDPRSCDDGLFCNGSESCEAHACRAGTRPSNGAPCTEGGGITCCNGMCVLGACGGDGR